MADDHSYCGPCRKHSTSCWCYSTAWWTEQEKDDPALWCTTPDAHATGKPAVDTPPHPAAREREHLLDHLYLVFFGRPIQLCGCGDPEAGVKLLVDTLRLHEAEGTIYETVDAVLGPDQGVQQVILSLLESAELTDHGSSLWGMHLTAKGRWVLWAVDQLGGVDSLEARRLAEVGFPHSGDETCTDKCWTIPRSAARTARFN